MTEERAGKILENLRKTFTMPKWITSTKNAFETLIVTVISQNTNDRNTARAFEKLSKQFKITPETLANAEISEIEDCLKVAGLYRNKAKTIKKLSKIILEEFNGDLNVILSLPLSEAREKLLQLPGVGLKTADVLLLFCSNKPTIPVDTHVNRVAKRLGLAPSDGDYEVVRGSLEKFYEPKDYLAVHVLLILLGRRYCKARNPLCNECPVCAFCPSRKLVDKKLMCKFLLNTS
jgi:endonuclease-3